MPTGVVFSAGFVNAPPGQNSVSADGSVVYLMTSPYDASFNPCPAAIFAVTPGGPIEISAPEAGVVPPPTPATPSYVGATPDGRTAYFMTTDPLTADDGNADNDLYRAAIDPATGTRTALECVSCAGDPTTDARVAGPSAVLSEDGRSVFFLTAGTIAGEGASGGLAPSNLFVAREGRIQLISATAETGAAYGGVAPSTLQATPDGDHVVFVAGSVPQAYLVTIGPASVGVPQCLSCANPKSSLVYSLPMNTAGFGAASRGNQVSGIPRAISDDGSTVTFEAFRLGSPEPTNGKVNVYLWSEGSAHLVNAGTEKDDTLDLGLSADGKDLFFISSARLTADATQGGGMLYDARVGGGSPAVVPKPGCVGEACQGPPGQPRGGASPGSTRAGAQPGVDGVARPAVSIRRVRVGRQGVRVRVAVSSAGNLTLAGHGVRGRSIATKGKAVRTVHLRLRGSARKALRSRSKVHLVLRAAFRSARGSAVTVKQVTVVAPRAH